VGFSWEKGVTQESKANNRQITEKVLKISSENANENLKDILPYYVQNTLKYRH
jgi:hypothetical protein